MKSGRVIVVGVFALAMAVPSFAAPAQGNVDEMREWLGQRNQERQKLGVPGASITLKKHFGPHRPRLQQAAAKPPDGELAPKVQAAPRQGTPVLHIGQGPDGRIHHRLIIKEDGPDQLQAYTPSGYASIAPAEAPATLERLTPRGRRVWVAGSSLRAPIPRLKPDPEPGNPADGAR